MNEKISRKYNGLVESILAYYQGCAPREQKLLLITSVVLPFVIVVFGLMLPIYDRIAELEHEVSIAQQQFSEAESIAEKLQRNPSTAAPRGDILVIVEKSLRELKIRKFITRMKPIASLSGKKSLTVQMKGIPYSSVIRLLNRMDSVGINLVQLKFHSTAKSGVVNIELKLQ